MNLLALIIGYVIIVTVNWYGVGFAVNSFVLYPIAMRTPPWRRSRKPMPNWLHTTYYFTCGPAGWIAWLYDNKR